MQEPLTTLLPSQTVLHEKRVIRMTAALTMMTMMSFGCHESETWAELDSGSETSEAADTAPNIQVLTEIDGPTRQALAVQQMLNDDDDPQVTGVLASQSGTIAYLFGSRQDTERLTVGVSPSDPVPAVFLAADGACIGKLPDIRALLADPGDALLGSWDEQLDDRLDACRTISPGAIDLATLAANLTGEAKQYMRDLEYGGIPTDVPVAGCMAPCGIDDGNSYAGQQAYSNGADTGKSSGCSYANCSCDGTSTYGYQYQCVEYTERVHQRSDWAGNAYPGYWSQTGLSSGSGVQGPYYKSLLPLGSGTVYAAPQPGDIAVWYKPNTYGHVGVIAGVGGNTVTIFDQNRKCGDQSCTLVYSGASPWTLSNGADPGYCGQENLASYTLVGYLRRGWDFGATYALAANSVSGTNTHNWWPNDATYVAGTTTNSVTDISDYITINPGPSDPYLTSPPGLELPTSANGYKRFSVYIQSNCANKLAAFYWKRDSDPGFDESRKVTAMIMGAGWQTLTFTPSANQNWTGTIDQVRIDPAPSCANGAADTISLQSAYFSK